MANILYITANPKAVEESYSLSVGQAFLESYRSVKPDDQITLLDLYQTDIPYIDADVFNGWGKLQKGTAYEELPPHEKDKVSRINQLTDQFVGADKYVFVTPLWNFSFPPRVKAYIDCICIAGKTFKYTSHGPEGMLKGKKALHIQARGGVYSEGPAKELEFGDRYLRAVLAFIGIKDVETIAVEGTAQSTGDAEEIKQKAIERAREFARSFAGDPVKV